MNLFVITVMHTVVSSLTLPSCLKNLATLSKLKMRNKIKKKCCLVCIFYLAYFVKCSIYNSLQAKLCLEWPDNPWHAEIHLQRNSYCCFQESMKMMGLNSWLHWVAWFTKYFIFLLITSAIMTIFLTMNTAEGRVIGKTNPLIIFLFLMCFSMATIAFCFLVSSFFSKGL